MGSLRSYIARSLIALLPLAAACHRGVTVSSPETSARAATSDAGAWRTLFDGTSMDQWRSFTDMNVPSGWSIVDGAITKQRGTPDIMTKDQFGDFELELEWKIGRAGNSGIFYRAITEGSRIYWSGPEYQLLDNIEASDNRTPLTRAGAAYGLYPAPDGHVKPVGEWNKTRIIAKGGHVEHWLNDFKLLEYELWSPEWKAKVAATKFKDWPIYGMAKRGHIGIQGDHAGLLAIRNVRIRELK
jgi:hypothetical protein